MNFAESSLTVNLNLGGLNFSFKYISFLISEGNHESFLKTEKGLETGFSPVVGGRDVFIKAGFLIFVSYIILHDENFDVSFTLGLLVIVVGAGLLLFLSWISLA